jgi:hypothetical protein
MNTKRIQKMTPRVKASVLNSYTRAHRQVVVFEVRQ